RKQKCTRAYRAAGAFRPSLRSGFTAYFVLFPENGSFASVAPKKLASQELSASTAAPEPHDFAVRFRARTSIAPSASTASHRVCVANSAAERAIRPLAVGPGPAGIMSPPRRRSSNDVLPG